MHLPLKISPLYLVPSDFNYIDIQYSDLVHGMALLVWRESESRRSGKVSITPRLPVQWWVAFKNRYKKKKTHSDVTQTIKNYKEKGAAGFSADSIRVSLLHFLSSGLQMKGNMWGSSVNCYKVTVWVLLPSLTVALRHTSFHWMFSSLQRKSTVVQWCFTNEFINCCFFGSVLSGNSFSNTISHVTDIA